MSDETMQNEFPEQDEKKVLLARAKTLKISVSNNSSIEVLREKINAKLNGADEKTPEVNPLALDEPLEDEEEKPLTKQQIRMKVRAEALKLVRLRIVNMDPKKKDLYGEFFTVANKYIGTVTKFIPYGEAGNSYHVPNAIYEMLKEKQFLQIRVRRNKRTGTNEVEEKWVKEFGLEVLPPLTEKELADLAHTQMATGAITNE